MSSAVRFVPASCRIDLVAECGRFGVAMRLDWKDSCKLVEPVSPIVRVMDFQTLALSPNARPICTCQGIMSLLAEQNALQFAVPGGLIGVGTKIDPKLTRALCRKQTLADSANWLLKQGVGVSKKAAHERPCHSQQDPRIKGCGSESFVLLTAPGKPSGVDCIRCRQACGTRPWSSRQAS